MGDLPELRHWAPGESSAFDSLVEPLAHTQGRWGLGDIYMAIDRLYVHCYWRKGEASREECYRALLCAGGWNTFLPRELRDALNAWAVTHAERLAEAVAEMLDRLEGLLLRSVEARRFEQRRYAWIYAQQLRADLGALRWLARDSAWNFPGAAEAQERLQQIDAMVRPDGKVWPTRYVRGRDQDSAYWWDWQVPVYWRKR